MPNKKLVDYIQQQLRRGYDAATVRNYLLKYGYQQQDIDEAIREIYSPEVRHVIHFSPTTLISVAGIFVGLVVVVFVFISFFNNEVPETLLDLNLESVKTTANLGSQVTFISELDNLGSAKRYDVSLKYELINTRTNDIVTFKEETRAIETKGSKQINLDVPSDAAAGEYVLRAIATYDGQRAVATLPVRIEGGASEPIEVPKEIPEQITEEPIKIPEEEEIPEEQTKAASSALTTFETLERVEVIAGQNSREAEKLCNELQLQTSKDLCFNKIGEILGDRTYCSKVVDERTKDVCLSNVAKIIGNSAVCEEIVKDSRKDSCYMNFVIDKKDYTVCSKVTNQYLRQSCESLKQLSKLNITDVAFYESLLNQTLIELV